MTCKTVTSYHQSGPTHMLDPLYVLIYDCLLGFMDMLTNTSYCSAVPMLDQTICSPT
jgi:hypothetical protein